MRFVEIPESPRGEPVPESIGKVHEAVLVVDGIVCKSGCGVYLRHPLTTRQIVDQHVLALNGRKRSIPEDADILALVLFIICGLRSQVSPRRFRYTFDIPQ